MGNLPSLVADGRLTAEVRGLNLFIFKFWIHQWMSVGVRVLSVPLVVRVTPERLWSSSQPQVSCLRDSFSLFSASGSAFFAGRAHVIPRWSITAMRFVKESIPSQSSSILSGVLNSLARRVNRESCLKRPPGGQQHAEVEPDHILLHLQSMTEGSGWNIYGKGKKNSKWWISAAYKCFLVEFPWIIWASCQKKFPVAHWCL